jgi:uncharacterized protein (TIGR00369 family)
MSMPAANLINPLTGNPTLSPLAVLVDDAGGMVNFYRHGPDEWAVSSELTMEFSPDAMATILARPSTPVLARGHAIGVRGRTSLASCTLTHGTTTIGIGTVRSFFISMTSTDLERRADTSTLASGATLADIADVQPIDGEHYALRQLPNPNLVNDVGSVHGGVGSAGLELVASAAINAGRTDTPLHTGSLRVNFLRPFIAATRSRYVGTALRVGRATAVGEATAIDDDGKVALVARITAYS